jgi:hypothetical protein
MRNLIFREGRLLLVIEYNKARTSNYHAFYIVRYPPPKLARLVYLYLVYVRPFISFLAGQLRFTRLYTTEFLFPDPRHRQKHLSSAQATDILKRLTQRFPTPMSISLYRQSALTIIKRYIKKLIPAANFYKPKAASDPIKMIATGVGHHPRVLLTEYAIDSALPARLQPELLEMYLQLSTLWQDWNEQYYQNHRHLWSSAPTDRTPSDVVDLGTKGIKRSLPPDDRSLPGLNKRRAGSIPASKVPLETDGFQYNAQFKILICMSCESIIQPEPTAWYRHLNSIHRITGPLCKTLLERFATYDLCPLKELPVPAEKIAPIPGLKIQESFRCNICPGPLGPSHFTTHKPDMDKHLAKHKLGIKPRRAWETGKYSMCLVQTFSLAKGRIRYFEVERSV